jgi:hypothetical protein
MNKVIFIFFIIILGVIFVWILPNIDKYDNNYENNQNFEGIGLK